MYTNQPINDSATILDGDDEADRKTVEWLKQEMERRERRHSATPASG